MSPAKARILLIDDDSVIRESVATSLQGENVEIVSFVGTPSLAGKYLLQFGGHHLAINATIKGAVATIAPALPGVQPASYTFNSSTVAVRCAVVMELSKA